VKTSAKITSFLSLFCRSKDFAFDVLMMPYVRDILMPYENALLKFNSRQNSKNTRYNIKKISSVLGREFQIETAKGLAKKFKQKCLFQEIYSLVIDY